MVRSPTDDIARLTLLPSSALFRIDLPPSERGRGGGRECIALGAAPLRFPVTFVHGFGSDLAIISRVLPFIVTDCASWTPNGKVSLTCPYIPLVELTWFWMIYTRDSLVLQSVFATGFVRIFGRAPGVRTGLGPLALL